MSFGMIRYFDLVVKMHSELLTVHLTNYACFSGFQSVHQDVADCRSWKQAISTAPTEAEFLYDDYQTLCIPGNHGNHEQLPRNELTVCLHLPKLKLSRAERSKN